MAHLGGAAHYLTGSLHQVFWIDIAIERVCCGMLQDIDVANAHLHIDQGGQTVQVDPLEGGHAAEHVQRARARPQQIVAPHHVQLCSVTTAL